MLQIMIKPECKRGFEEDEVAEYFHGVSPIKISKSNNSYFVRELQTDTNVFR